MTKRWTPELLTNYSPVVRPMPPLTIHEVCEGKEVCLSFSCAFVPYLLGLLEIYRYPFAFSGTEEERERSAGLFRDLMEEIALSCNDQINTTVIDRRVGADGTTIEISMDGGQTWIPDPQDPRNAAVQPPFPVVGLGGVDRCFLANRVVNNLKLLQQDIADKGGQIDTFFNLLIEIAIAILATLFLSPVGAALIIALVVAILNAIKQLGVAGYNALFTDEVWNTVRCAVYCNLPENGIMTGQGYADMIAHIRREVPGFGDPLGAQENVVSLINTVGLAGILIYETYGSSVGEPCDECDCIPGCALEAWEIQLGTLVIRDDNNITCHAVPSSGGYAIRIRNPNYFGCCCFMTYELIDGIIENDVIAYNPCGLPNVDDTNLGFSYTGQNTNLYYVYSTQPFTARLFSSSGCV